MPKDLSHLTPKEKKARRAKQLREAQRKQRNKKKQQLAELRTTLEEERASNAAHIATIQTIATLNNVHANTGNNITTALGLGLQRMAERQALPELRQEQEVVEARTALIVEGRTERNIEKEKDRDPCPVNCRTEHNTEDDSDRDPCLTNCRTERNIEDDSERDPCPTNCRTERSIEDDNNQNFRTKRRRQSNGYHRCGGYDNSDWDDVLDDYLDPQKIGWNVVCGAREAVTEIFNVLRKHHDSIKNDDDQAAHDFFLILKDHVDKNFHEKRLQTSGDRKLVETAIHSVADAMFGKGDERMPLKSLGHVKHLFSNSLAPTSGKQRKRVFYEKKDAHGRLLEEFQELKKKYHNVNEDYHDLQDENRRLRKKYHNVNDDYHHLQDENRRLRDEIDHLHYHIQQL